MPPHFGFPALVAALVLADALWPGARVLAGLERALGGILILGGLALHGAATRRLRSHRTPIGADDTPADLVQEGPFSRTRNPMYLAGVLILVGLGLGLGTALAIPALAAYAVLVRPWVLREEGRLESEFGKLYLQYRSRVRRWL